MGWRLSGGSQYPKLRVIPCGTDADETAAEATRALEYFGAYAYVWQDGDGPVVCCVRRGHARSDAEFLLPGRQLVVGCAGGWRIEAVPVPAVVS